MDHREEFKDTKGQYYDQDCHEPRYCSVMDRYKTTLSQGKQVQDTSLWFPYDLGPDGPWEIHAVTL